MVTDMVDTVDMDMADTVDTDMVDTDMVDTVDTVMVIHISVTIEVTTVPTITVHTILDIMTMDIMAMETTIMADTTDQAIVADIIQDQGLQTTADTITAVCQPGLHMDTVIQEYIPVHRAGKPMHWELTIVTEAGSS